MKGQVSIKTNEKVYLNHNATPASSSLIDVKIKYMYLPITR